MEGRGKTPVGHVVQFLTDREELVDAHKLSPRFWIPDEK